MRICQGLLCDNAADLYWHGPWCAACADKRYGRVPMFIAELEMSQPRLRPQGDPVPWQASGGASVPPSEPAFTEAELLDTLASHGLLDPVDLEWELVQRLEEPWRAS